MGSFQNHDSDKKIIVKVNNTDQVRRKSMFNRPEFKKNFKTSNLLSPENSPKVFIDDQNSENKAPSNSKSKPSNSSHSKKQNKIK